MIIDLNFSQLRRPPFISAFSGVPTVDGRFYSSIGGVSTGIYVDAEGRPGLNCALGGLDDETSKLENRGIVAHSFGVDSQRICTPTQSRSVVNILHDANQCIDRPTGNALVMAGKYDLVAGVLTADCAPILFADRKNPIAAVAHIGWQAALDEVVEETVKVMRHLGSRTEDIAAAVGPCAGVQDTFFVSDDFVQQQQKKDPGIATFFKKAGDSAVLRLQQYITGHLRRSGIKDISCAEIDTITDRNYYSRRRDKNLGLPRAGLMFSGIRLRQ